MYVYECGLLIFTAYTFYYKGLQGFVKYFLMFFFIFFQQIVQLKQYYYMFTLCYIYLDTI